jgi:hypothetical protein
LKKKKIEKKLYHWIDQENTSGQTPVMETKPAGSSIAKQNGIAWVILQTLTIGHRCLKKFACFV